MFSRTVMCGKRLYDWKTTPIRRRTASWSARGSVISSSSSQIAPSSISSSRFAHRSSVDLPEPEAPISAVTVCGATSRSTSRRTTEPPKVLRTDSMRSTGVSLMWFLLGPAGGPCVPSPSP